MALVVNEEKLSLLVKPQYAERVRRFADQFTFTEINVGTSFAETPQAEPSTLNQDTE